MARAWANGAEGSAAPQAPGLPALPLQTVHLLWNTETGSVSLEGPKQRHTFLE